MDKKIYLERRDFIKYSLSTTAIILTPQQLQANWFGDRVEDIYDVVKIVSKYQPVRFIGAIIYNIGKSFIVDQAKDWIVAELSDKHFSKKEATHHFENKIGESNRGHENNFHYTNYKASTVGKGISEYELDKNRKIKVVLNAQNEIQKFETVRDYLIHNRIKIKLANQKYAHEVIGASIEPDDLFLIERINMPKQDYENLIKLTNATNIANWAI
jgi:hypothetical protein